jgi:toxin ParE1/3/4
MRVKFHPEARVDLREGKAFYRQRSPLAAVAFAHQIEAAVRRIGEAPLQYPPADYGTREHVLPSSFPYTLVYRVQSNVIIVAVAHQSREPGYWHRRH